MLGTSSMKRWETMESTLMWEILEDNYQEDKNKELQLLEHLSKNLRFYY